MPKRIASATLNQSTINILNVIRKNAPQEYQNSVPKVEKATDIPKVGEVIYGTPAHANYFVSALVNRIALVRVQSAVFNNPYTRLKKGYLEFGETVEEIFVNIAKVMDFNPEKAESRELKRYIPDVEAAFHIMNWRVTYPVTIQEDDLKLAFLSINGVQDLIARIVDSIYTAAEYDEFLLFKYLLIKAISSGKMYPVSVGAATTGTLDQAAIQFRGISNLLPFMSSNYNEANVKNTTPKDRQIIFMDAMFNAQFDVEVLASAFNMGKADYMGSLFLMDNWGEFDNERWSYLRTQCDGIEEVTEDELALLQDVKAVLIDEEWFQVYDNNNKFTEKFIASGDYWNYFYHVWKTLSHSPFSNAVVFCTSAADVELPESFTLTLTSKLESKAGYTLVFTYDDATPALVPQQMIFQQTEDLVEAGIAVQQYGEYIIPTSASATDITVQVLIDGVLYTASETVNVETAVDSTITLEQA